MAIADIKPLAAVTGASTGIGYELAKCCAKHGYDLLIAADEPEIDDAARKLRALGAAVEIVRADLATRVGVDQLCAAARGRAIDALLADAGRGLGKAFLDEQFDDIRRVIDTSVTGTMYLLHKVGSGMRARGRGKILIARSSARLAPGTSSAVYDGTKAFLDSFAFAFRKELDGSGVTVTCLLPGSVDTELFSGPGEIARVGFEALRKGDVDAVAGLKHRLQAAAAAATPAGMLAERHRKIAEPGSARKN
jgi:short-subunit dehydrogenase